MVEWRVSRGGAGVVALALGLALFASSASASGQRGTALTPEGIEGFQELTATKLGAERGLHYAGSTDKWHVFMRVLTSTGGGMPFDHLDTYKVAVSAVTVANGWSIRFSDRIIEAANCPLLRRDASDPTKARVPSGEEARRRCGT